MGNKKVLVADAISPRGVEALAAGGDLIVDVRTGLKEPGLLEIIPEYAGLVVRSQTKVTGKVIEAADALKAIGRAGVGVDNVDVEAATRRGIIVMNTPGGNTVSTAEHAFSLLVSAESLSVCAPSPTIPISPLPVLDLCRWSYLKI